MSSPKVTIVEGETGYITQDGGDQKTFIEVIAKEGEMHGKKGILLNMKIGSIGHRTQNGTDDVLNLDITVTRKTF